MRGKRRSSTSNRAVGSVRSSRAASNSGGRFDPSANDAAGGSVVNGNTVGLASRSTAGPSRPPLPSEGGWAGGHAYTHPGERPLVGLNGDDTGFSTHYGASASSPGGVSEEEGAEDYFVSARGDETEVEPVTAVRGGPGGGTGAEETDELAPRGGRRQSAAIAATAPTQRPVSSRRSATSQSHHPAPPSSSVLPIWIGLPFASGKWIKGKTTIGRCGCRLTRRRCEDGLLLGAVVLGVWKLGAEWDEWALAGEISLLIGLSILYTAVRVRGPPPRPPPATTPHGRPQSPLLGTFYQSMSHGHGHMRERTARMSTSHGHGTSGFMAASQSGIRDELRRTQAVVSATAMGAVAMEDDEPTGLGARGCVWGTEEREYRECLDDGVLFALLLGPLVASALLHGALFTLSQNPSSATPKKWMIEPPLVLPSSPIRQIARIPALPPTNAIKALSALVTSRRNLVQLFTLCSFVLLVHLVWSLRLEVQQAKLATQLSSAPTPTYATSAMMDRDVIETRSAHGGGTVSGSSAAGVSGTYWLRRGEWRRTRSVVGFSFVVTGGCVLVKIATAFIGRGVWSDMSPSDIVIATLFYQFSLYVCVRLARRGFTLGELAAVCSAATALFMETVNMTRMKIRLLRTPYIKTYRLPTPLLTFQLALIPGSLLAGFLLSPLLYLSRHLAQRPAHRLRFPHEKPMHRRLLALGFYSGAAIVCGGLVGTWTRWCLGWREPFVWVLWWLLDGRRAWTRPALISYWGALAMISVAGWSRQLSRARRHRRYVVPGVRESGVQGQPNGHSHSHGSAHGYGQVIANGHGHGGQGGKLGAETDASGLSGVAMQMMDAADQRMPTLSVNARRKFFHALAVVMFVPGIAVDPAFTHLSFSVAFAAFNFAEYIRYFALWPFGVSVHLFLNEFLDHKDSGTAILSHFYLLAGCASPLWLEGPSEVLAYFGVLVLGIGDALASIVGRRAGRIRWSTAGGKTVEGSVAFLGSVLVSTIFLWAFGAVGNFKPVPYVFATCLATLLEAFSAQNDNLILPMYGWAVGTLLGA